MSADHARLTYYAPRKYREVLSQQGRVLLEADWNEEERISTEETRHEALDFVGPCGTPDDGYAVAAAGADFTIGPGTMYTGGLRTSLEVIEQYTAQPDWLDKTEVAPWAEGLWQSPAQLAAKNFAATLMLREQEITAVEDPSLRDVALGGPDTAARTRLLQRVVAVETQGSNCAGAVADVTNFWSAHGLVYDPATAKLASRALLQVTPVTNAPPPSPCDPPSATGYLGADNQMIRVLVTAFDPANNSGTLLWGYYNASTLYRCSVQTSLTVKLATKPVSAEYQPRSGQVVQILQRAADLGEGAFAAALTGHFAKLNAPYAPDTQLITLPAAMPQPPFANASNVYLRLWEDQANFTLGTPVVLPGTGLQVTITPSSAGPLHIGDYWSMALRPLTPNSVYPERIQTSPQPPDGPRMWACPLAVLSGNGHTFTVIEDCRLPFDNLVELTARKSSDCCCIKVVPNQAAVLQRIIDQAVASAGAKVTIELEAGTYALRRPLVITSRHKGLVISSCTGGKAILRVADQANPEFLFGLILASEGADLTLRGIEFQLPLTPIPEELPPMIKKYLKKLDWVPRSVSFGIRTVYCDSLRVEDCNFQFPRAEQSFGAGILVQGDTGTLEVRRSQFFGPRGAVASILTGILGAPVILPGQDAMRPMSINLTRIEDCLFGFLALGVLLGGEVRFAWAERNTARGVYGGFYLISLSEKFRQPGEVLGFVPPPSLDPKGKAKAMIGQLMGAVFFVRALGVAMVMGLGPASDRINDPVAVKEVTLGNDALRKPIDFPPVPGSLPASLCLTLQGNQFECRPLTGELDSMSAVFLWDANVGSCSANITGNTLWNRSPSLPTLTVVTLSGFNVTGNLLTNDPSATSGSSRRQVALWVGPAPAVPNAKEIPVNMMTVTGNTIFGGTNLGDFPRQEWSAQLPKELGPILTWEFFNTIE